MIRNQLKDILLQKYREKSLASFYLIRAGGAHPNKKKFLREWINDGLHTLFPKVPSSLDHPDFLFLSKKREKAREDSEGTYEKDYTLEEFQEFFSFLIMKPFELPHRFLIVEDVHLIGEVLGNKILKSLEEPGDNVTIFFLDSLGKKLLPTIQGRAIQWRIPSQGGLSPEPAQVLWPKSHQVAWFQEQLEQKGEGDWPAKKRDLFLTFLKTGEQTAEVMEMFKKNRKNSEDLLSLLVEWERQYQSPYLHKKKFLEELAWFSEAQTYYNAPGERLFSLLQTLFSP